MLYRYDRMVERKVIESKDKTSLFKLIKIKLKYNSGVPTLSKMDGSNVVSMEGKAEFLAETFEQVYMKGKATLTGLLYGSYSEMQDSLWFKHYDILEMIQKQPSSFSLTPDGIPFAFNRKVAAAIAKPLEYIFNLSLSRAEVPDRWKHSYVTPLRKKPPYNDPSNYRPVSITSVLCRIFEKIIKKTIVEHLDNNDVLSPDQHGFRKSRSTVT
ncbi:hypothetical protein Y032_0656g1239 [Ancylostoma ceylanicum]|uniref:Uncharacterized protein n=1 Tax=Ancylostoma ceylanicum TaxID=53326 RepID=A0A016WIM4_9BILA|nr:hypothetical protein Y032_0656g1239 [Ancylostoma ceylanicum]